MRMQFFLLADADMQPSILIAELADPHGLHDEPSFLLEAPSGLMRPPYPGIGEQPVP